MRTMRSFSARDFSFFKSRMLSATHVNGKKTHELLHVEENSTSEPRPSDAEQYPSQESTSYEVNDSELANRELVDNHFDQDYLETRSNLLAYGKQMKRVEGTMGAPPLPPPPNARARELESRSWKAFRTCRKKPPGHVQESWLSRVRRSPSRNQAGSKSRRHLLSRRW